MASQVNGEIPYTLSQLTRYTLLMIRKHAFHNYKQNPF